MLTRQQLQKVFVKYAAAPPATGAAPSPAAPSLSAPGITGMTDQWRQSGDPGIANARPRPPQTGLSTASIGAPGGAANLNVSVPPPAATQQPAAPKPNPYYRPPPGSRTRHIPNPGGDMAPRQGEASGLWGRQAAPTTSQREPTPGIYQPGDRIPGTGAAAYMDKWYNPNTTNTDPMSKGEEWLMRPGQVAMGTGLAAGATAAAVPALAATGLTAGGSGAMTAGGAAMTAANAVGNGSLVAGAMPQPGAQPQAQPYQSTGVTKQQPATRRDGSSQPAGALDLNAQNTLANDLPNMPEPQARAAAQDAVQNAFGSASPEAQQGIQDLAAGKDTEAAQGFKAQVEGPVKDQFVQDELSKQTANKPDASPTEVGGMMNSIMEGWNNMPEPMKWMMGLGLGTGLLGVLSSMFGGGGGGMGLLGLLGLGAAGAAGAAGGMFGQGGQDMMADALSGIGQFTGMMPEKLTDEQKKLLLSKDPVGQITNITGQLPTREQAAQQLTAGRGQLDQLRRLNSMGGMTPRMLQNMGLSPEEAALASQNVGTLSKQYADPDSPLNAHLRRGEDYSQKNWSTWAQELGARGANFFRPKNASARFSQAVTTWASKSAMNAVDQKELADLKKWHAQTGDYDVKKTKRMHDLKKRQAAQPTPAGRTKIIAVCMKSARCWTGYEPVPGKKPYSNDSCRPVRKKKPNTKPEKKSAASDAWLEKFRARGRQGRWVPLNRGAQSQVKKIDPVRTQKSA